MTIQSSRDYPGFIRPEIWGYGNTERNTRGRIFPVQFSLSNPEICVPEQELKILEQRVKKQYKPHQVNWTWSVEQISDCFHKQV